MKRVRATVFSIAAFISLLYACFAGAQEAPLAKSFIVGHTYGGTVVYCATQQDADELAAAYPDKSASTLKAKRGKCAVNNVLFKLKRLVATHGKVQVYAVEDAKPWSESEGQTLYILHEMKLESLAHN